MVSWPSIFHGNPVFLFLLSSSWKFSHLYKLSLPSWNNSDLENSLLIEHDRRECEYESPYFRFSKEMTSKNQIIAMTLTHQSYFDLPLHALVNMFKYSQFSPFVFFRKLDHCLAPQQMKCSIAFTLKVRLYCISPSAKL